MLHIIRMQISQILGGKMKWMVLLILLMPVLLTMAAVFAGALDELSQELEEEAQTLRLASGELPASARRIEWEGELREFLDGEIQLLADGVSVSGRPVRQDLVAIINDGQFIVLDGELWSDPEVERRRRGMRVNMRWRRPAGGGGRGADLVSVETLCTFFLFLIYPQTICLLIALFYGTSVLGHELGGKTLTYLFTRPLPRWKFVLGKYLGIICALIVPTMVSLLASWLLLEAIGGLELLLALLVGSCAALLAYTAVFVLFGFLVPRRAIIVALLYAVIFELVLGLVPALVNQFTVTYYVRSLVVGMLELEVPKEVSRIVGGASLPGAVLGLAIIIAATLVTSSWLAANREYVIKDEA